MDTVTHFAGPRMVFDLDSGHTRVLQRCSVCGEKMVDSLGSAVVLSTATDDDPPEFPTWEFGSLVQYSVDQNPRMERSVPHTDRIPRDSCIMLVE